MDLANGHCRAIDYVNSNKGFDVINLGTGRGYSVLEVIKIFEKVSGKQIPYQITKRRKGDIAKIWASADKAKNLLNWTAIRNIEDMCIDMWRYMQNS